MNLNLRVYIRSPIQRSRFAIYTAYILKYHFLKVKNQDIVIKKIRPYMILITNTILLSVFDPNPLQEASREAVCSYSIENDTEKSEINQGKIHHEEMVCYKHWYAVPSKEIIE